VAGGAHKAQPVEVSRGASVHELARVAVRSALHQMRLNTRGARTGKQPGFIHQLRVGARRARVVIKLFRDFLDPARARAVERDLRWVFRVLGEQRDRDVLLERLHAHESEVDTEPLERELRRQRDRAARAATRALSSQRYQRTLRGLGKLASALGKSDEPSPRARKWAKKRMNKRLRAVLALREAVSGADDEARHELRKELKKLRYTAELVRGLYGHKRAQRYLDAVSELQDALGALNDVATGARLLGQAAERLGTSGAESREILKRELEQIALKELDLLQPGFDTFEASKPFWK
jgi:triphosphatase